MDMMVRNLFLMWLAIGLWYGAEGKFLMWCLYQPVVHLSCHRCAEKNSNSQVHPVFPEQNFSFVKGENGMIYYGAVIENGNDMLMEYPPA